MLGWELSPHRTGGMGLACSRLARSLTRQGTDVLFVLPCARGDEEAGDAEVRGCGTATLPIDSDLRPYLTRAEYAAAAQRNRTEPERRGFAGGYGPSLMDEVARYAEVACELCEGEPFDLIHAHDWMTFAAGLRLKERTGKPLVCHVHSSERDRRPFDPDPEISRREQAGFDGADRIVCVSRFAQEVLGSHYRVDPRRLRTVHHAIDGEFANALHGEGTADTAGGRGSTDSAPDRDPEWDFRRDPTRKRVLFLGRVTEQKGPLTFLEAAALVAERLPEVDFVVSGEGDQLEPCRRRAEQLGIADRVDFTGHLEGDAVPRAYASADLFVLPSVSEPFGLTALEAMACGVPVLLCRQSGAAEVLRSSVQFEHWDVADLARKILAILRFPALAEQLVAAGQAELAGLGWDASALRLRRVYEEVLG